MNDLFNSTRTRILGLIAFIATGGGLILSTAINEENFYKTEIIIILGSFFILSLVDQFKITLRKKGENKLDKKSYLVIICAVIGVTFTWFLNHRIGYGGIVSNGLIGLIAGILLPKDLAGIIYTSSFVGMSSLSIIPSIEVALLGGVIVGIILLATADIYEGIGGKGGTTAALSTIITRFLTIILK